MTIAWRSWEGFQLGSGRVGLAKFRGKEVIPKMTTLTRKESYQYTLRNEKGGEGITLFAAERNEIGQTKISKWKVERVRTYKSN